MKSERKTELSVLELNERMRSCETLLKKSLKHVISAKKDGGHPHLSDHTPLKAVPRNVALNFSVQHAHAAHWTWPWADPTGHKTAQPSALSLEILINQKWFLPLRLSVFTSFTSLWFLMLWKVTKSWFWIFLFCVLLFLRRNFNTSSSSSSRYDTHINCVVFFLQVHQWPFQRQLCRGVGAGWQLQVSGCFSKLKQLLQLQSPSHSTQTRQVPAEPPAESGHGLHLHLHLRIPTDLRAERSGGVTPAGGRAHGWMDGWRAMGVTTAQLPETFSK